MATIGVTTTTATRSGPNNRGVSQGRLHVAGLTERGPVDRSVLVRSLGEYVAAFGARTAYSNALYDTARTFFEEGGAELVVSRVVGSGATKGSLTLMDTAGSPVPTLRIEARDPGAFSTIFTGEVTVSGGTFTLTIYRNGERIARYANLANPAAAVTAAADNPYVVIRDLGSSTVAPGNNPAALAVTAFIAGSDDREAVVAADVLAALDAADQMAIGGMVAAPGYSADVIGAGLLAHAAAHKKVAALAMDEDATVVEATTAAATLAAGANGSYGGLFYPHLIIPDGNATRRVSPEGYVAAVRARAFATDGFWQVPAGERARTRWVMGTVSSVSQDVNNTLNDGLVNGIITTNGKTRLYNWTSLASDRDNYALLSARDVLNNLSVVITDALEPYVFGTVDGRGHFLGFVQGAVAGVLAPIAQRGGFYARFDDAGEQVDPGWRVVVDRVNNPDASLTSNKVNVTVSVRLSPTAALIQVEIIKVALTASV